MKKIALLCFCIFLCFSSTTAQNINDWVIYRPLDIDYFRQIKIDSIQNKIWIVGNKGIGEFDPLLIKYNQVGNGIIRADITPSGKFWAATVDDFVQYDPVSKLTKPLSFPQVSNQQVNKVLVESENKVWLLNENSYLYEVDSFVLTKHYFSSISGKVNNNMREFTKVGNSIWATTAASIGIENGFYTPPGVVRFDGKDFTFYPAVDSLNMPNTTYIVFMPDKDKVGILVEDGKENTLFYFEKGKWVNKGLFPMTGYISSIVKNNKGIYYATNGKEIIRGENGVWTTIFKDPATKIAPYVLEVAKNGDVYFTGSEYINANYSGKYTSIIGLLPAVNLKASGTVFIDSNKNSKFDVGEIPYATQLIESTTDGRAFFSTVTGSYVISYPKEGNYSIKTNAPKYFSIASPSNSTYNVNVTGVNNLIADRNFALQADTNAVDVTINLTALNRANPAFDVVYALNYQNLAAHKTSVEIICTFDALLTLKSCNHPIFSQQGNQFTFKIKKLDWIEKGQILFSFTLPPDNKIIGQTLTNTAKINVIGEKDLDLSNNTSTITPKIVAAYDPNLIEATPEGNGNYGLIAPTTKEIEYTIHFQNVGGDKARNIIINNDLDTDFELKNMEIVASSHPFELNFDDKKRKLIWTFKEINLVEKNTDELKSCGFIKYKMKNIDKSPVGTVFNNRADIYFDFNTAIKTNKTIHTIANATAINEVKNNKICAFTLEKQADNLFIKRELEENIKVILFDIQGKIILKNNFNGKILQLNINDFNTGIYGISIISSSCPLPETQLFSK